MKQPKVIYEDNHLLVVEKPAGLLTQPAPNQPESLESWAKQWIKETHQKPGNVFLHAVHRLDKPVSGLVLFAKTSKALERLNASVRAKEFQKTYAALVEGELTTGTTLVHYLLHSEHHAQVVVKNHPQAKEARLSYKLLELRKHTSLIEIDLETGRYHQIRLQLSHVGHPIIGDTKYGSRMSFEGIALHHTRLQITHPVTKESLCFDSPIPF